jgi:hypothetical protein
MQSSGGSLFGLLRLWLPMLEGRRYARADALLDRQLAILWKLTH